MATAGNARAEIISGHHAHPSSHNLMRVTNDDRPFTCDGCKEPCRGATARYRCEQHERCGFRLLHACCAVAPALLNHHRFGDDVFIFHLKHPAGSSDARFCAVCSETVPGFVYHCPETGSDLHPCCALRRQGACLCSIVGTAARRRLPYAKHRNPFCTQAV